MKAKKNEMMENKGMRRGKGIRMAMKACLLTAVMVFLPGKAYAAEDVFLEYNANVGPKSTQQFEETLDQKVEGLTVETTQMSGYYYEFLNDAQKTIYQETMNFAANGYANISWSNYSIDLAAISDDDFNQAIAAMTMDHPELWYVKGAKRSQENNIWLTYSELSANSVVLTYRYTTLQDAAAAVQEFNRNLPQIVSEIDIQEGDSQMTMLDKIGSWTDQHVDYTYAEDLDYAGDGQVAVHTLYGPAVLRKCVCEGYAYFIEYFCARYGMQALRHYGTFDGDGHAWNMVNVSGIWYEADATSYFVLEDCVTSTAGLDPLYDPVIQANKIISFPLPMADQEPQWTQNELSSPPLAGEEPQQTQQELLPGDLNGNGTIDLNDITIMAQYYRTGCSEEMRSKADVNGDGIFNVGDICILAEQFRNATK